MGEQRRAKRPYVLAKVMIKPVKGGASMEAVAINLSRKGIGVYIKRSLKQGRKVLVQLTFFDEKGAKTTEATRGTIRLILELGGQYAAGIDFDHLIRKKDQPILYSCFEQVKRHA